jgi:hypothetical protein
MTEEEWLLWAEAERMLDFVESRTTQRKLRLVVVACCRKLWADLPDEESRWAVEVGERFADGLATEENREAARQAAGRHLTLPVRAVEKPLRGCGAIFREIEAKVTAAQSGSNIEQEFAEQEQWCQLLRDIFGNPFRWVGFNPAWRTDTAVALARQLYESRDFSAMPILADTLQDAGCDDTEILGHCRGPGPHVRGCWVVDRVLGRG